MYITEAGPTIAENAEEEDKSLPFTIFPRKR
jgi:hypothetical protein